MRKIFFLTGMFLLSFLLMNNKNVSETAPIQKVPESVIDNYLEYCASCHGGKLEGGVAASSLRDNKWLYGSGRNKLIENITKGIDKKGMPAWEGTLSKKEIEQLADYILSVNKPKRKNN